MVGVLAFAAGRLSIGGHAPTRLTLPVVRRTRWPRSRRRSGSGGSAYGLLAPAGPGFAIAGRRVLFAAVHVATYGFAVLPLDLAAGALLGWQRAVTGSWAAPGRTHVLANLFVLL